jgi:hypothetical protein
VDNVFYVIGGRNGATFYKKCEMYDPVANSWTAKTDMPTARSALGVTASEGIVYAIGGLDSSGNRLNKVEAYCPANNTWWTCTNMPTAREGVTATAVDGIIYAIGGRTGTTTFSNKVEAYNPKTNTWDTSCSNLPLARGYHGATMMDGLIYVVGGFYYTGTYYFQRRCDVYNPKNDTWFQIQPVLTARAALAEMGIGAVYGKIYAVGGNIQSGSYKVNEVFSTAPAIDRATISWDATVLSGTYLIVEVSIDNGTNYKNITNHQIVYFGKTNETLKYKITMKSIGTRANTPVLNWIQIDQSNVDYGINPSVCGGSTNRYIAYQKTSLNNNYNKNITFARSFNNGTAWNYNSFPSSSQSGETGVPKLVRNNDALYLIWVNKTGASGNLLSVHSYNRGKTWKSTYKTIASSIQIPKTPYGLSAAVRDRNLAVAYTSDDSGSFRIYTFSGIDNTVNTVWSGKTTHTTTTTKNPQVAMDSLSNLYLTWMETDNRTCLRVTNASAATVLMPTTLITKDKTQLDYPVIALDPAGEIHIVWKEKVGNNLTMKYWDNVPHTPDTMVGSVDTYLELLPEIAFKDNAAQRRAALRADFMNLANDGDNVWRTKSSMSGGTRSHLGASATSSAGIGKNIYAIGGYAGAGAFNRTEGYNPTNNSWWTCRNMPTARLWLSVAAVNSVLYAIGGEASSTAKTTVEAYCPANNTWWTCRSMTTARSGLGCAAYNGVIYACGGQNNGTGLKTVQAYCPANNTWWTCHQMGTQRMGLAVTELDGIIYAIGGQTAYGGQGGYILSSVEAYSPANNTWWYVQSLPTTKTCSGATSVNGVVYAIGGRSIMSPATDTKTVHAYSPLNNTWWSVKDMGSVKMAPGACALNNKIYSIGGYTVGTFYATTEEYSALYGANYLQRGNWNKTLERVQYRVGSKTDEARGTWIVAGFAQDVMKLKTGRLVGYSYSLQGQTSNGVQLVEDFATTQNIRKYGSTGTADYTKSHVNVSNGVATFKMWNSNSGYGRMEWAISSVSLAHPIYMTDNISLTVNYSANSGVTTGVTLMMMDNSGITRTVSVSLSSVTQSIEDIIGLKWTVNNPDFIHNSQVVSLSVWVSAYGYGFNNVIYNSLSIWPQFREECVVPSRWTNYDGGSDTPFLIGCDYLQFPCTYGSHGIGTRWFYNPMPNNRLELQQRSIYCKFKTSYQTGIQFVFEIEGKLKSDPTKIGTDFINIFYGQDEISSLGYRYTEDKWEIRCIDWSNIYAIKYKTGIVDLRYLFLIKNIFIDGLPLGGGGYIYLDYFYIVWDLDGDKIPDYSDYDVDADRMMNYFESSHGLCKKIIGLNKNYGCHVIDVLDIDSTHVQGFKEDGNGWQDIFEVNKRFAVCVGINMYGNIPGYNIDDPDDDANDWNTYFTSYSIFTSKTILVGSQATKSNILSNILKFVLNANPNNDLIVYTSSGHGKRYSDMAPYISLPGNGALFPCYDAKPIPSGSLDGWLLDTELINIFSKWRGPLFIFLCHCKCGGPGGFSNIVSGSFVKQRYMVSSCTIDGFAYGGVNCPYPNGLWTYWFLKWGLIGGYGVGSGSGRGSLEMNFNIAKTCYPGCDKSILTGWNDSTCMPQQYDGCSGYPFYQY